ncbi:putative membrane protein YfcA [Catenuloplanes nepalensis]|uniref:Probable membrane transporter protein n=1 Tax=Catenuloplanes nepalensis TaxID=587533 RepID=A0ABT9MRJ6_9ACTN|nr:sulfite exporter TauE/SafE family protein [Catenuloplanes nepalensis]MDP9794008.1 putative membrane protein YfcA [Catenuloplanes nepalensis]
MELTAFDWVVLAGAACLIGFAKTGVGGVAGVAVAAFAMVLPAKESTAAILVLLIVGDVLAVALYRKHADWRLLARLLPAVVPGLVFGAWFVHVVDQAVMRRSIAVILLVMVALQLWTRRRRGAAARAREAEATATGGTEAAAGAGRGITLPYTAAAERADVSRAEPTGGFASEPVEARRREAGWRQRVEAYVVGTVAGFATMTANAAGPVMTLYLLLSGRTVMQLLGTGAWYFLLVNVAKVPFSAGLRLFSADALLMDLLLVPALLAGAAAGTLVARRISLTVFGDVTLVLTSVAAALLLL